MSLIRPSVTATVKRWGTAGAAPLTEDARGQGDGTREQLVEDTLEAVISSHLAPRQINVEVGGLVDTSAELRGAGRYRRTVPARLWRTFFRGRIADNATGSFLVAITERSSEPSRWARRACQRTDLRRLWRLPGHGAGRQGDG